MMRLLPPAANNRKLFVQMELQHKLSNAATGGTTWYDAKNGCGNTVASPTQSGWEVTYYAQTSNGTCSSLTGTTVVLTINDAPATFCNETVCTDGTT
jgi:hypothetical protein